MISDVIYQLKHEYGKKATFTSRTSFSTDVDSGAETVTSEQTVVRRAIKLENHFRQNLLKVLGAERVGFQLVGDFEILIDKKDLKGKIISIGDSTSTDFGAGEIIKIDEFDAAYILSVKR